MGEDVGSISKNRPSHHKYKKSHKNHIKNSPRQFLLIAHLSTSALNGSKRTLCKLGATSYPLSED